MPGLWGGYSRDTREIYLSADCPQELLSAVLIEEIGHFLDQELCSEETPGEEGARFAAAVLGLPLDAASSDDSLAPLFLQGSELHVEAARKSRGSSKAKSSGTSGKSRGKKRGSSSGGGSNSGGGSGYAEVGGSSSNPKLQENIIYATQDSARIPQKAAGDRLIGSRGNDTFVVISQDVRIEDPNGGIDTVESSVTFSLATHSTIENLLLTGGGNINGTGNLKANVITGNSGNNKLDGGIDSAIDTLQGGAGNDTYVLRDTLDQIVEAIGSGTDTIETTQSSFSMVNYANVENLAYSGTGTGVTFTGNSGNNALTGTDGADSLDGGDGVDTLNGGKGDDIYIVDNSFDLILDDSGTDSVYTSASRYTLAGGLENLFNAKDSAATLVGNSNDNSIKGGAGKDSLCGGAGNDTLFSSSGSDSDILVGGTGNDFYVVSSANKPTIQEDTDGGTDTVLSSINHTLASGVENLTFVQSDTDKSPVYNSKVDITGDYALAKGNGSDVAIIYPNGKPLSSELEIAGDVDWVRVRLSKGSSYRFDLKGASSGKGTLQQCSLELHDDKGNIVAYDQGGAFLDDLIDFTAGNTGDYYLKVFSYDPFYLYGKGTYELTATTILFADALDGLGNSLDNKITGNAGNNNLIGKEGNDTLDGGDGGQDTFDGGPGDDYFLNWNEEDRIVEAASANKKINIDTISSSKLNYFDSIYLGRNDLLNIEKFLWEGETTIQIVGNFLDNTISSRQNTNDVISGGSGNDYIEGGGGDDLLDSGYAGWFYYNRTSLFFSLTDSEASSGIDTLVGGDGSDTYIINSSQDRIIESFGPGLDEVRALVSYTLAGDGYIEDLVAISASANSLKGNDIDNRIEAFAGTNSTLDGGDGADVLVGKSGNDSLYGGLGSDLLQGGLGDDTLNAGNDSLNADYMQGGMGNDLYILNNSPAFIEEGLNEGIDAVQASADYTLDLNVENLIIVGSASVKGTGNELDNFISGNSVANTLYGLAGADTLVGSSLAGDDYMDGGVGADSLSGGEGNDTLTGGTLSGLDDGSADTLRGGDGDDLFLIYSRQDDFDGEGDKDTVYTPVTNFDTRNLFENLYLGDGDFDSSINEGFGGFTDTIDLKGFGDNQSNLIVGNAGDNILDGAGGADTLIGGLGDDTIIVDDVNDWVFDVDGNNVVIFYSDSVSTFNGIESFIGSTLRLEVIGNPTPGDDTLTGRLISDTISGLQGNDSISGLGANDSLSGNDGDDTLDGGEGFDTLVGGEGNDFFVSGGGEDTFIGGNGNDVYQINWDAPDKLIETSLSDGTDTILTDGNFSLAPKTSGFVSANDQNPYLFIENLVYDENRFGVQIKGVSLTGNTRSNSIQGGTGADTLDGGISFIIDQGDTLNGGTGNDLYIIRNRYDWIIEDTLTGLDNGIDTVHTYINFDPLDSEDRNNVTRNTSFASKSKDLQYFARLDHFVFMGDVIRGVGNARDNSFTGNYENNVILGLAGNDTILGNAGNDSLYGDADNTTSLSGNSTLDGSGSSYGYDSLTGSYPFNPGDYVSLDTLLVGGDDTMKGQDYLDGGDGNDLLSGNGGSDTLLGGSGSDILDGGSEVDSMVGGAGDDIYYSDEETDTILELADEGNDIIFSTKNIHFIQDNLENAVIYGPDVQFAVGNSIDNVISVSQKTGDVGAVTLFGGEGNDKLYGYYGKGVRGYASLTADMDDDKARNVGDYLVGGAGNDLLDGGQGVDTLEGGLGNDTICVDSTDDKIWEFGYEGDPSNGGTDWVITKADIDLKDIYTNDGLFNISLPDDQLKYVENGMFIENLMGASTSGQTLSGNWLNNTIVGGVGADSISGEEGKDFLANNRKPTVFSIDTLTGGAGGDTFSLVDYSDGVSALYADEFTSLSFFGVDSSYAYITDFSSDKLFLPTVLPDLNGDGQAAKGFVYADLTNPHTGLRTIGLYIYDVKTDSAGDPAYRYNLIAMGDNLI
jgi:Ca2+-binding RTX toxin-like protein